MKCSFQTCTTQASFGFPGEKACRCASHREDGMVDIAHVKCLCHAQGCGKRANFAHPGGVAQFCKDHMVGGMVDVNHSSCIQPGCANRGTYRFLNQDVSGMYCREHAKPGMIMLDRRLCQHDGCDRRASYGPAGGGAVSCKTHIGPGMVDLSGTRCAHGDCAKRPGFKGADGRNYCSIHAGADRKTTDKRVCHHESCTTRPAYGHPGHHPTSCAKHKVAGMVDVVHKACATTGCAVRATCAAPGSKNAKYCKKHAPAGWVTNDKKAKCTHEGCTKTASYGLEVSKKATRCATHKEAGMVDVAHRACAQPGCRKKPSFAPAPGQSAVYCKEHAQAGMANVTTKQCYFEGCTKRTFCGLPGTSPTSCGEHRTAGMIAWPLRKCACGAAAAYGCQEPTHCQAHHDPERHMDLVHRECTVCGLVDVVDAEARCARCSDYLSRKLHLVKQRDVRAMLQATDLPAFEQYDKQVDGGFCGPERPDFVWTAPTHVVVLEVDEDQHKAIPRDCEDVRMKNVTGSFGMPVFWVRYNPDAFQGQWPQLTPTLRHDMLVGVIRGALAAPPEGPHEFCRVVYLFYDGLARGDAFPVRLLPVA